MNEQNDYATERIAYVEATIARLERDIEALTKKLEWYKSLKEQERKRAEFDELHAPITLRMAQLQGFVVREQMLRQNRFMAGDVLAAMVVDPRIAKWVEEINQIFETNCATFEERERVHQEVMALRSFGVMIGTHRKKIEDDAKRLEAAKAELESLRTPKEEVETAE